ncbi:MAG: single-stranded DNA-binding protein [Atopobiaceae bacterium]|jgi:single-strand DNA-binding protein
MSINRVTITGNLTRDPELRQTQGGSPLMTFGVAVNDRRRNQQTGEWEDVPNFVDCVMFGTRAEAVSRFISKGSKVAIEGKLRYSSWEREGQRRSKLEVIVDEIEFLSSRGSQGASQGYPQGTSQGYSQGYAQPAAAPAPAPMQAPAPVSAPSRPVQTPPKADVYDEDIPF